MFAGIFYLSSMALLGAAAPYAWDRAEPHVAAAGESLALAIGLERLPEALPDPGRVVVVDEVGLAPLFAEPAPPQAAGDLYAPADRPEARTLPSGSGWIGRAPEGPAADGPRPAVVLLAGSDARPGAMIEAWAALADREGLVLIEPSLAPPLGWPMAQGPAAADALDALLSAAETEFGIDRTRLYLVGNGSGGTLALHRANDPGPWRAAVVHGTVSLSGDLRLAPRFDAPAIRMQVGTATPTDVALGPARAARATADALARMGHDVAIALIPEAGGWYYERGPRLAADAWEFLSGR